MKVSELRQKLKDRKKDELQLLIVEMYKQFPKKIREAKEIDQLIDNPGTTKTKKGSTSKIQNTDFDSVESETSHFIEDARAQYYFAPNRLISKKERSNWRFTAKRIVEQVTEFSNQPEHAKACASLLEELYKLFCYASGHYVFASQEPFRAMKIPQGGFLKRVVLLKKRVDEPSVWIRESLLLIVENDSDHETPKRYLSQVMLGALNNAPLKEEAVRIGQNLLQEKEANSERVSRTNWNSIAFKNQYYINDLVEMIFMTQSTLGEYQIANDFFKQNYIESIKEVKLFILLKFIMHNQRVEDWNNEYKIAVQNGIKPREALEKTTEYIKRSNEFPAYMISY